VIGGRPGARIEKLAPRLHDKVQAGAVLAILEGHSQAETQLALAVAQKAKADRQRAVKKQQLALEREQFNKVQAAKLESAQRVFGSRQRWHDIAALSKQLTDDKNLPARDRFDVMLRFFEAENQTLRGELEIKSFEAAQQIAPRQRKLEDEELGDTGPDHDLLNQQIELARAGVALAEVRAPIAGEVLDLLSHVGEVSAGPLLLLGDTSVMVATAEVFQGDVTRIQIGDSATVRVLEQVVPGKVTTIGSVVGRNQLNNLDPRALQDRRVLKVTIRLDDPAPAQRLINMEVEVTIQPGGGRTP
jgi:HlyD family secretion protein